MTRPVADVERARALLARGLSGAEVSRQTGISWSTIKNWRRAGVDAVLDRRRASLPGAGCACRDGIDGDAYAHLLGLYLGDGCLAVNGRNALRLTISCDARYPRLINEAASAIERVSGRRPHRQSRKNCVVVHLTSLHWRCLFPQHGPGRKHDRRIELEPWQRELVVSAPGLFVRGLVNSDGCRVINRVKGHEYVRYQFTNHSEDLRNVFQWACSLLGVDSRQSNAVTISVSRRESVDVLERLVGPKS